MSDSVANLRSLAQFLSVGDIHLKSKTSKAPVLHIDGKNIMGFISIAKNLVAKSSHQALLGCGIEQKALVDQWMEYRLTRVDKCSDAKEMQIILKELNEYLVDKVFLVGHHLSLADILLYQSLHKEFEKLSFYEKQQLLNVSRWFDQVQNMKGLRQQLPAIYFQRNCLYPKGSSH